MLAAQRADGYTTGMDAAPARLWIGPSGWSYDDWQGIVYPRPAPRGFKPLAYLARYFNAVEVNSSFYRTPSARMTAAWPKLVPAEFRFTFKLHQDFTHRRGAFPPVEAVRAFKAALEPVREAGRLGPLLLQFPWSFRFTPDAADWLRRLAEAFAEYARSIEVRHGSWATDEAQAVLRAAGGCCNIDQPALRDCLGPTAHAAGGIAYVRLHGRNAAAWFASDRPAFERYNYLYSEAELREWVQRVNALMAEARDVYVFANNHYKGQGPVNALELRALVTRQRVAVPAPLLAAYPRLAAVAAPAPPAGLFET